MRQFTNEAEMQPINTLELENLIGELVSFQIEHDSQEGNNSEYRFNDSSSDFTSQSNHDVVSNCTSSSMHLNYDLHNMDITNVSNISSEDIMSPYDEENKFELNDLSSDTGYENPSFQHLNDSKNDGKCSADIVVLRNKCNQQEFSSPLSELTEQRLSTFKLNRMKENSTTYFKGSHRYGNSKHDEALNADSIIDSIRNASLYSMYSQQFEDTKKHNSTENGSSKKSSYSTPRPSSIFYGTLMIHSDSELILTE